MKLSSKALAYPSEAVLVLTGAASSRGLIDLPLQEVSNSCLRKCLSIRQLLLAIMSIIMRLLCNFTYICCHKFRVPLGTAREERSLLWQQSDWIVSAIKADKAEARMQVFSIVLDLLLPSKMLKPEPRA